MNIGWQEVLVFLVIILILFGAKKVPDLARALGRSIGEFKKGKDEGLKEAGEAAPDKLDKNEPSKTPRP